MSKVWGRLLQASLARRLLFAQMALLLCLWLLLMGFAILDAVRQNRDLSYSLRYDLIFSVTQSLADRPAQLHDALAQIDRFQHGAGSQRDSPEWRILMQVWRGKDRIYASPEMAQVVENTVQGTTETLDIDGHRWRAHTRQSADTRIRVTLAQPADLSGIFLTHWGYLLLPLLVCLPLMALPAWLSVRLALRPWKTVSEEIARRGPQDLSPLAFRPAHRELRPLVDSVNAMLRSVSDSARRERDFISDAAHEMRTPLAAMRVNIEALQAHWPEASQQALLDGSLRGAERATRLVNQLLALMRTEAASSGPPRARLALEQIAQDSLAALSPLARERRVELELQADCGAWLMGEVEGLRSLVDNLVDNAIKYSRPGGLVTVSVRCDAACAVLTVADEGPGVPPELHARLGERFYRVPGQVQAGSGLGLAIVSATVARHGGRMGFGGAARGRGLVVTVRVPLCCY